MKHQRSKSIARRLLAGWLIGAVLELFAIGIFLGWIGQGPLSSLLSHHGGQSGVISPVVVYATGLRTPVPTPAGSALLAALAGAPLLWIAVLLIIPVKLLWSTVATVWTGRVPNHGDSST